MQRNGTGNTAEEFQQRTEGAEMIHELKTYRFTFDPSRNRWQVETPRQYRKLGTSRTGLKTYEIRNIPEWLTRAELAIKMPHPPEHGFYLDYDNHHLWQEG